jgi:opacity protein-like surface antigen
MNGPRIYLVAALGFALVSTQILRAGTDMETAPPAPAPTGPYDYHVHANVRDLNGVGLSAGVYGGITAFQDGGLKITESGSQAHANTKSVLGETAGVRITNVWPNLNSITGDQTTAAPGIVLPAMAFDVFWTHYNYKANGTGSFSSSSFDSHLNTITAAYMPELKFNLGSVRPYIGVGVGATYLNSGRQKIETPVGTTTLNGTSSDWDFSAQGVAGVEFFLDPRWALSLEYKYLYILDPSLKSNVDGTPVNYHLDGLSTHYVTAGLNYYF